MYGQPAQIYEAAFGSVAEDGTTTTLTVSLRADLAQKVKRLAVEREVSLSKLVSDC